MCVFLHRSPVPFTVLRRQPAQRILHTCELHLPVVEEAFIMANHLVPESLTPWRHCATPIPESERKNLPVTCDASSATQLWDRQTHLHSSRITAVRRCTVSSCFPPCSRLCREWGKEVFGVLKISTTRPSHPRSASVSRCGNPRSH